MTEEINSPGYTGDDEERWVSEPPKRAGRTAFARDRARVLHSAGLRRLAAKTQVITAGQFDFPRTRLTHTLEVAQIARELGAVLGCDADLVEVAGLAHDLGHPPFGHNGEDALHEISTDIGGFEGNAQSLRVMTRLEAKTFAGDGHTRARASVGLNLTRATLDAMIKYPIDAATAAARGVRKFNAYMDDRDVFDWVRLCAPQSADGNPRVSFESQVMDWADDVAYSVHDVEDAIHAGWLRLDALTSRDERDEMVRIAQSSFARGASDAELLAAIDRLVQLPYWVGEYDGSHRSLAALKNLTSQLIGRFCTAAHTATRAEHGDGRLTRYNANLVTPVEQRHEVAMLKSIAVHFVMRRSGAEAMYADQRQLLHELVAAMRAAGRDGLEEWLRPMWDEAAAAGDDAGMYRVVLDQVACLTDISAVQWHRRFAAAR
ncbi:MAG: putative dGTPase [Actinomycetota bacterium]|jgi:dGTPase